MTQLWAVGLLHFLLYCSTSDGFNTPPLIIPEPEIPDGQIVFQEGNSITVPCRATGDPAVKYRWEKDGNRYIPDTQDGRISLVNGTGSFIFNSPIADDEGYYQCFASNTLGANTATALSTRYSLRLATLDEFNPVGKTFLVSGGSGLTIPCNQPTSYPLPIIAWNKFDKVQSQYVQMDHDLRVTVDLDGQLQFSNIIGSDDGNYRCFASNTVIGRYEWGPVHKVVVNNFGGTGSKRPEVLWGNPVNDIAIRGENKTIKCVFSGVPTPQVDWRRTDGNRALGPNVERTDRGQTLVFTDVTYDNEGLYECQAVNADSQTPSESPVHLTVRSKPRYLPGYEPMSLTMAPGETAVFYCDGESVPKRQIVWFFDASPISTDTIERYPHYIFTETSITIKNVTEADRRSISCNITNDPIGFLFKGVYLNVLRERPEIVERPVPRDTLAAGQDTVLKCVVFGAPRPVISWTRNGVPLTGGRFLIQDDGNLFIQRIEVTDNGVYTCTAENDLGSATASTIITVRRHTQIQNKPVDLSVTEGSEAKFTCTAVTDADENENLVIRWKKDGQFFETSSSVRFYVNEQDNSLIIGGATPFDDGEYTCVATNGLDSDEASAVLRVQGRPSPPARVYIEPGQSCSAGTVAVSWDPGPNNNAPIVNYILQFNTSYDAETWYTAFDNIDLNKKSQEIDLSPGVTYSFRLLARNKLGVSDPSAPTITECSTTDALPTANPSGVRTLNEQPDQLVITWQPVPKLDWNGANFKYIIRYRQVRTGRCQTGQEWCEYEFLDQPPEDIRAPMEYIYRPALRFVQPYEAYEIEMRSANIVGPNSASVTIIGHSGEGVPSVLVEDFTVRRNFTTAYNVSLQWKAVDPTTDAIRGLFRGYRIQFAKTTLAPGEMPWVYSAYVIVDDSETSTTISGNEITYKQGRRNRLDYEIIGVGTDAVIRTNVTNLPPFTEIDFRASVINSQFAGSDSITLSETTGEGNPGPVESMFISEYGPTHVILSWTPPLDPNGFIVKYEIGYQTVTDLALENLQRASETNIPALRRTAKLTGLQPLQRYRFIIWAYTVAGQGEEYYIEDTTVAPGYPGTPIMEVNRLEANNTLLVSWEAATDGVPASVYYVQYRRDSALDAWDKSQWVSTRSSIILNELSEGWQYEVRVVASNGGQYETVSASQFVYPSAATRTAGDAEEVFTSPWFISLMIGLIFLAVVCILAFYIRGNRGGIYSGEEKERLVSDYQHDFIDNILCADLSRRPKDKPEATTKFNSKEEESDVVPPGHTNQASGNYREDGSFIGAYRNQELPKYSSGPLKDEKNGGSKPQPRVRQSAAQSQGTPSESSLSAAGRYYAHPKMKQDIRPSQAGQSGKGVGSDTGSEVTSVYSTTNRGDRHGNKNGSQEPRQRYSRGSRDNISHASTGSELRPQQQASRQAYNSRGSRDNISHASAGSELRPQPRQGRQFYGSRDDVYNSKGRLDENRYDTDDGEGTSARSLDDQSQDKYDSDGSDYTESETSNQSSQTPLYNQSTAPQRGPAAAALQFYTGGGGGGGRPGGNGVGTQQRQPQQGPPRANLYNSRGGGAAANRYNAAPRRDGGDDGGTSQSSAQHSVV